MLEKLRAKLTSKPKSKSKKHRTPCLCGCGSTCPKTIAAHQKLLSRRANVNSLGLARSVAGLTGIRRLVPTKHSSRRKPKKSTIPPDDQPPEDAMQIDDLLTLGHDSAGPSTSAHATPLMNLDAEYTGWRGQEDEDLVSEPGSPVPSEDEDEAGDRVLDYDEPEFLSDDEESSTHVEIPAREQLTADFQLHAAKAGTSAITRFC